MAERIYLVDGSGYIFRAFYAVPQLSTSSGFPTNALFGFIKMISKLLSEASSDKVAVVFDTGKETFRKKIFPAYKANRSEPPSELVAQLPYFREIAIALGLPVLALPGYEADDVIGTLCERLTRDGHSVTVVSGDKDMMQLVSANVDVWDTLQDKRYGASQVVEKWGVEPARIADLLALTGDSSDNIPGVAGIGPKTALHLLGRFQNLEGVLENVEVVREDRELRGRERVAELLASQQEQARLSKELATICCSAPVLVGEEQLPISELADDSLMPFLARKAPAAEALRAIGDKFEFHSLLEKVAAFKGVAEKVSPPSREHLKTIWARDFDSWAKDFKRQDCFALDLETTSLHPREAQIVGVAICWQEQESFYIPLMHQERAALGFEQPVANQCDSKRVLALISERLSEPKVELIGHNLKYDLSVLLNQGIQSQCRIFDTMIAAYLMNPDRGGYGLTAVSQDLLQRTPGEFTEVVAGLADFRDVPVDKATQYAGTDALFAFLLYRKLNSMLAENKLGEVAESLEFPLVPILAQMEWLGVHLEPAVLKGLSVEFAERLEVLQQEIYELAGEPFNLNSPKQLSVVLFDKLGLPTKGLKRTKTGVSTDSSVLEVLAESQPIAAQILKYRLLHKLKSTYVDTLPEQISKISGRVHSRFNQTGTGTGRLSSSDPNLQNIPIASFEGRRIRAAFTAPSGRVLISADYSQIELRLLAHLSGDDTLIAAFEADEDIHARTARQILGLSDDQALSSDQRRIGKTINFGVLYGMSGARLGRELEIPVGVATKYIKSYFDQFPKVQSFFAQLEQQALERGEVRTLFGRRRVLNSLDTSGRDRNFVARVAVNAPIQGSAADLIKLAMVRLNAVLKEKMLPCDLVLQVHDELVFECDAEVLSEAEKLIRAEMEQVAKLAVPLRVDLHHGSNWGEAHG